MTDRTLADIIRDALFEVGADDPDAIADYIRSAYLIHTPEQLRQLPVEALLVDYDRDTLTTDDEGLRYVSGPEDDDYHIPVADYDLYLPAILMPFTWDGDGPATVIDVPVSGVVE